MNILNAPINPVFYKREFYSFIFFVPVSSNTHFHSSRRKSPDRGGREGCMYVMLICNKERIIRETNNHGGDGAGSGIN